MLKLAIPFRDTIKDFGKSFIDSMYPEETAFFPVVWNSFTAIADKSDEHSPIPSNNILTGIPFAARESDAFVSPYVILTLDAIFQEMSDKGFSPDLSKINTAIQQAATTFGAPPSLINKMIENLGPALQREFSDLKPSSFLRNKHCYPTSNGTEESTTIWVEWCNCTAGENQTTKPEAKEYKLGDFEQKFKDNKGSFALLVDELTDTIVVRLPIKNEIQKNTENLLNFGILEPRHRIALGLFLQAFRHRRQIPYDSISVAVSSNDYTKHPALKIKSELDNKMKHILKEVVKSVHKQEAYEIRGQISYCWIRYSRAESKLFR